MHSLLLHIAAILLVLYFCNALVLGLALARTPAPPRPQQTPLPPVSIIVPARNEAENMPALLHSLLALDYPLEKLQIIIADDASTDATAAIARRLATAAPHLRIFTVTGHQSNLNGKANAIHQAMPLCTGDIIFITDADCRVPRNWIRAHLAHYDSRTGMVGGFVLLIEKNHPAPLFARLQALDWLYLTAVGSAVARLGLPLSIFGNNYSFRKIACEHIGGFAGAGFSVIEDFALMRALQKKGTYRIALPADPDIAVLTRPVPRLGDFFQQRKRWTLGSRQVSLFARLLLALGSAGRFLPYVLAAAGHWLAAGVTFLVVVLADALVVLPVARRFDRTDLLRPLPLYEIFAAAYTLLLLPVYFFSRSVQWKQRKYEIKK